MANDGEKKTMQMGYPKIEPDYFFLAGGNFGGVVDLDRDVGHHGGLRSSPQESRGT